jgi:hypothetical protein
VASFRQPKGVLTRTLPDWNSASLMCGSGGGSAAAGHTYDAGVWNNASDGSLLVLWDLTIAASYATVTNNTSPDALGGFSPLNPGGGAGINLYNGQPAKAGQVWSGFDTFNVVGFDEEYVFPLKSGAYQWPHNWPIAIINPGFGFAIEMLGPIHSVDTGFIWEVISQV